MVLCDIGAKIGQRIKIEKVLLIGSKDFTLIGRPLLPRDLINVEATVVEKTLSHKKPSLRRTENKVKKVSCKYFFLYLLRAHAKAILDCGMLFLLIMIALV